jgi:hypothetical protein
VALTEQLGEFLQLAAPLEAAEREVAGLGHLFRRRRPPAALPAVAAAGPAGAQLAGSARCRGGRTTRSVARRLQLACRSARQPGRLTSAGGHSPCRARRTTPCRERRTTPCRDRRTTPRREREPRPQRTPGPSGATPTPRPSVRRAES